MTVQVLTHLVVTPLWLAAAMLLPMCSACAAQPPNAKSATVVMQPADYYVAVNGSDKWSGKLATPNSAKTDGPFATLERARDEIRKVKTAGGIPAAGITVEVRGGLYECSKTLELTAEDSGTATAPVVYCARTGETVRLTGGRVVTGWKPVADPKVLARLDTNAQAHVVQVDLKAQGITGYGVMKSASIWAQSDAGTELFFDEQPMTLARWPNEGYMHIADLVVNDGWKEAGTQGSKVGQFVYEGDRPTRWVHDKEIMLHGYWFFDWADQRFKVGTINDAKREITLEKPADHPFGFRKGQWFYAYNLLCELDQPGEWYVDRENGILYFWPPSPVEKGTAVVSLMSDLIAMKDVSWVTLRGFTLECGQGTAVVMTGGTGNRVEACTIRNMGKSGVTITGGTGNGIVGCDLYQLGDGGIVMSGGDRKTLTPGGHFADNNHIHHCSRWNPLFHPGIQVLGVGQSVTHNLIDNLPHVAIGFMGNEHRIEYNEIHSCVYQANDAGAVYTCGSGGEEEWTMRGHMIRYNYLHDLYGFEGRGCQGVYLDDGFSSADITHNIFYKLSSGIMINGGRDNLVENNAFIDCPKAFCIYTVGTGGEKWLTDRLKEFPYQNPPWSTRYPKLVNILDNEPMKPKGNEVICNISCGGEWGSIVDSAKPCVFFKDNIIDVDPLFTDSKRQDFRLRSASPALALGFQPIPIEKMGLYADTLRASWPVSHTVRPAPPPPYIAIVPCPKTDGSPASIQALVPLPSSCWSSPYKGTAACTATLRMGYSPEGLHLLVEVQDPEHIQTHSAAEMYLEDSIQIAIDADKDSPWFSDYSGTRKDGHRVFEYGFSLGSKDDKVRSWCWSAFDEHIIPGPVSGITPVITRTGKTTRYFITLPWSAIGLGKAPPHGSAIGFALGINDVDGRGFLNYLQLFGGIFGDKEPKALGKVWLR